MDLLNYKKYIKYKLKYLQLKQKKQIGGMEIGIDDIKKGDRVSFDTKKVTNTFVKENYKVSDWYEQGEVTEIDRRSKMVTVKFSDDRKVNIPENELMVIPIRFSRQQSTTPFTSLWKEGKEEAARLRAEREKAKADAEEAARVKAEEEASARAKAEADAVEAARVKAEEEAAARAKAEADAVEAARVKADDFDLFRPFETINTNEFMSELCNKLNFEFGDISPTTNESNKDIVETLCLKIKLDLKSFEELGSDKYNYLYSYFYTIIYRIIDIILLIPVIQ